MKRHSTILLTALIAALASVAQAQNKGEVLIKNATIMTASHGVIEGGSILVRDGKIAAVGKNSEVRAGANARVIDATGMYVTPGIIDAHSHSALDSVNEGSVSVSAMVRMKDVVDNTDISIYRQLAGGTTTIHSMHGSANSIGGQNVILKLKWGKSSEEMIVPDMPRTIKFALGENPKRAGNQSNPFGQGNRPLRFPATRMGVEFTIREAFQQAREYMREWDEYAAAKERGGDPAPPRRDIKLEAIADILRGKLLVHSHCYRADEILMLMNVADEFGWKVLAFQHVLEGYKVAKEMAAHGAGGSTFSDWWAYKIEAYDAIPGNAAIMHHKGVVTSVNSDSADLARRLYQEAAKTIKYGGLTDEEALRFITLNPAKQLKMDHRIGSIDVGKDGDLAIFNANPFSIYARVEMTLIEGEVYFDRKEDMKRRETIAKEKKELIEKERRTAPQEQRQPMPPITPTVSGPGDDHP
ncbi:MAG TPA: amidohydrolase family protein, partial [Blastocatellia bacterium]|nr:amidohydrolase family protein [Blastocatellia bacterium]